jgi:hypothetical protein
MPRYRMCVLLVSLVLVGCTADPDTPAPTATAAPTPTPTPAPLAPESRTVLPAEATAIAAGTGAAELSLATSALLFRDAPAVVLVGEADAAGLTAAGSTAIKLGVPLLLTPRAGDAAPLLAELRRLAPRTVVAVGSAATRWANAAKLDPPARVTILGAPPAATASAGPAASATPTGGGPVSPELPRVPPATPLKELLVLALNRGASAAAIATARATGARVVLVGNPDPRTEDAAINALAGQSTARVLALGSAFGPVDRLRQRIDTAATGVLLPAGRQVIFPGRRFVALYGHPGNGGLGVLGEQDVQAAIARAKRVAASYAGLVREPVVPTFEIITTVASASAGADGDYSRESSIAKLRPWVDAARRAGVYVMLDLQPGRTDFLTQAKRYEELLRQPHVGLALDPEWRLKPDEVHLVQIGSVTAAEINRTGAWLAQLTRDNHLPQKLLMLHQFRLDMIINRPTVRTDYDELKVLIHADGFGSAGQKFNTWRALHGNAPPNVYWGWKNFYDEDKPTFTPGQTVNVRPSPVFVSYQ